MAHSRPTGLRPIQTSRTTADTTWPGWGTALRVAEDSPAAAVRCLNRVESRCRGLAAQPGRGRVVPELGAVGISIYRELIERPWRIVYRQDKLAHVPAVLDARRDLSSLLLERLVRQ
ncbi:MAG: type II toxin-antitoxin system RelE/ParE family toxin [Gammaproteobacteria bacterium]|nr:type II toxin-antitoxin system RelE/ParE family toxin [Gammaproteobacteria bacterium]